MTLDALAELRNAVHAIGYQVDNMARWHSNTYRHSPYFGSDYQSNLAKVSNIIQQIEGLYKTNKEHAHLLEKEGFLK